MEYRAFEDQHNPGDWCVEAQTENGEFLLTFFVGPHSQQRAQEYLAWKGSKDDSPRHADFG
jgi:hypothetical protein